MDPDHIDITNGAMRLKSSFFSDAASFGSSCLRQDGASEQEYVETVEQILRNKPLTEKGETRKVYGLVSLPFALVKAFMHTFEEKGRKIKPDMIAFCVYATGERTRPHHCEIMVNAVNSITKSKANRATRELTKAVQNSVVQVQNFQRADLTRWG